MLETMVEDIKIMIGDIKIMVEDIKIVQEKLLKESKIGKLHGGFY
jgi:hypothetical protein